MSQPSALHQGDVRARIEGFFEPRAAQVDCCEAGVKEGLVFLNSEILPAARTEAGPNGDLLFLMRTASTVAWSDMSTAFTLWCQRMVMEYVWYGTRGSGQFDELLDRLERVDLLGSTGLAAAMAHVISGAPLPITWRQDGNAIVLNGRINWASNLSRPDFVLVTAAAHEEDGREIIVAIPGDAPGLEIDPYPELVALQSTRSSSLRLVDIHLGTDAIITDDFGAFVAYVRPRFLLVQSGFAWGIAARSLSEARGALRGVNEVMRPDLEALESRRDEYERQLIDYAAATLVGTVIARDVVQLRLNCAQLATASVALEAKAVGGRGYLRDCSTVRRMREVAFLPVQAPTEGQLRWELSHSA
jgi:alkylation response protein AidB-like acyl-CoA dehydrogenase